MRLKKVKLLMKEYPAGLILTAACITLLSSCGDGRVDQVNSRNQYNHNSVFPPKIVGESSTPSVGELIFPYTISRNSVKLPDGTMLYVNIEMTEGEFFDRSSPKYVKRGGVFNTNYLGFYRIAIYTDSESTDTVYTMPVLFDKDQLNFEKEFSLIFDDYNNDGNPDFTLGQWADDNGSSYQLFTILPGGEIKQLPCEGLSAVGFESSLRLIKASPTSFSCEVYDAKAGENVTLTYSWKDGAFVLQNK